MRNGVRSLFKQICFIYSVSRLFSYIMEGLKSKNARQRAECLEVMGSIIEDYGKGPVFSLQCLLQGNFFIFYLLRFFLCAV